MSAKKILEELAVTIEMIGGEFSPATKAAMAEELMGYSLDAVLGAFRRCRRECKGRLTMADILTRLDDGRPAPEEAWALYPKDEASSAAVTNEMHLAMNAAWPLIQDGDRIAGRMAFKEAYERIVAENRAKRIAPEWQVTLGHDKESREHALIDAVQRKRIGMDQAMKMLPHGAQERFLLGVGATDHPLLAPPTLDQERNKARIREILATLSDDSKIPEEPKPTTKGLAA